MKIKYSVYLLPIATVACCFLLITAAQASSNKQGKMLRKLKRLEIQGASYQRVRYYVVNLSKANPIGVPKYYKIGIARLPDQNLLQKRALLANFLGRLVHRSGLSEKSKARVQSDLIALALGPL